MCSSLDKHPSILYGTHINSFHSIIGHTSQLAALEQDIATNNVNHAYLLSGSAHIGKRTIAKQFATMLLCSSLKPAEQTACSKQVAHLLHPDFIALDALYVEDQLTDWDVIAKRSNVPQLHRAKKKVKTDTISIDDIRILQDHLYGKPIGTYRVCFIANIERMTIAAANAFLKILEEPPSQLVFILTSTVGASLLPTITSRARVVHFGSVPVAQLLPLVHNQPIADQQFIIDLAQGAPGIVVDLLRNPAALVEHKNWHAQAQKVWRSTSFKESVASLEPLLKRGPAASSFLVHLSLALRALPYSTSAYSAYCMLTSGLQTNVNRSLLMNQCALLLQATSKK